MLSVSNAELLLSGAGVGLEIAIGFLLCYRRLVKRFPVFSAYVFFQIASAFVLIASLRNPNVYFYLYWSVVLFENLLSLAVIYEIYNAVLEPHDAIRRLGQVLFRWAAAVIFLVACFTAVGQAREVNAWMRAIYSMERSILIVEAGLLMFLFIFASSLGLSLRHYLFGISTGLALQAVVSMVLAATKVHYGSAATGMYKYLKPAAFDCALLVWFCYLVRPELQVSRLVPNGNRIELWNRAFGEFLHQ
jgi:hypothetical protein